MLLIYVPKITNRLGYTLNLIFQCILKIDFRITLNVDEFINYSGAKLSYCDEKIGDEIFIKSTQLLFSTSIEMQNLSPAEKGRKFTMFPVYSSNSAFPFDILAASFYLASRYEEYLPYKADEFRRFDPTESLAFTFDFLEIPLVNYWAKKIEVVLKDKYPALYSAPKKFKYIPTFNIDNAYAYKHKGPFRSTLGIVRSLFLGQFKECFQRVKVLLNIERDPDDVYNLFIPGIRETKIHAIFFILCGKYGEYDKNISIHNAHFQTLIKQFADYAKVGIQRSFISFDEPEQLKNEIQNLSTIIHKPIKRSRAHYTRIRLPESYQQLIENNIEQDFSMGYATMGGFRASLCTPFNFYDLEHDYETKLSIHPFAIMDEALVFNMKKSPQESVDYCKKLIKEVKSYNGIFYCTFHNKIFSNNGIWEGYQKVYDELLQYGKLME